jgi:histidinol phosphatase-like PHP family hydrolase
VVASVHAKLGMEPRHMTERMLLAVASPHVDILGHCTGRKVKGFGSDLRTVRAESAFDADLIFAACAHFGTAVEINCRPERQDPPPELLDLALDAGCLISIDTDAHSPGHLEFLAYGCDKAVAHGIEPGADHQHLAGRRAARLDRGSTAPRSVDPYVEEDGQAQDQRPAQEGQPRHQAQRRPLG